MSAVRVLYKVKESFAEENAANIRRVMAALRANPVEGLSYAAFRLEDGQSFMHVAVAQDEPTRNRIAELPEFKAFQTALRESGPVEPPSPAELEIVGTSYEL